METHHTLARRATQKYPADRIVSPSGLWRRKPNEIRCLTAPAMAMSPSGLKKKAQLQNSRVGLPSKATTTRYDRRSDRRLWCRVCACTHQATSYSIRSTSTTSLSTSTRLVGGVLARTKLSFSHGPRFPACRRVCACTHQIAVRTHDLQKSFNAQRQAPASTPSILP